jgi:hypothetical protein
MLSSTLFVDLTILLCSYCIYLPPSAALQPFDRPWSLFQFLNSIQNRQDSLDGGSARRKAATYTQNNTNRINAHRHPCLEWDSNPRFQHSSEQDSSCFRLRDHCDRRSYYMTCASHKLPPYKVYKIEYSNHSKSRCFLDIYCQIIIVHCLHSK